MSSTEKLDVAVVGAGIAGLAAGIALCRAGHHVTIYERSEFKSEVGAAINMAPQATRILQRWGLAGPNPTPETPYQDAAFGKLLHGGRRRNPKTAEMAIPTSFQGDENIYGAPFVSYHRADLHAGLRKLAQDAGAEIVLGKTAAAVGCSSATLTLVDSAGGPSKDTAQKDLIILADGVSTEFVKDIIGYDIPTQDSGMSVYRALIPIEKVIVDADAGEIFANGGEHFINGCINSETGVFLVMYPCRSGVLMNVAIIHPVQAEEHDKQEWGSPATIDEALQVIHDFHPAYKAVVKHADLKVYKLQHRDPLPTYINGRAIMIGDAAHPMFPTIAGGGSSALEDAAALEILLEGVTPSDSALLADRLSLWNALRLPRGVVTQVLSSAMLHPKPANAFADQLRHVYTGPLPDQVLGGWHKVTKEFICPYDVFDVSKKAMGWAVREGYPDDMMMRLQDEDVIQHFG